MISCRRVRSSSARYVDGEMAADVRSAVDAHLATCRWCREAIAAEQCGREALVGCRRFFRERAAAHLGRAVVGTGGPPGRRLGRVRLAASLALVLVGIVSYSVLARGGTALAAQLAVDHIKCVRLFGARPSTQPPVAAAADWEQRHGWRVTLPAHAADQGFTFVTLRRCVHTGGTIAHALYRRGDHLVSFFIFPTNVQASGVLAIMGERASFWSQGGHTYAVVGAARDSAAELDRFVALARAAE
jgi:anti-sigma factor RsiW